MNKSLLLVAVGVALATQAEAGCLGLTCHHQEHKMPEYKKAVDTCQEELCKDKWTCKIPFYRCKCLRKCRKDMIHVMRECVQYQEECNSCFDTCSKKTGSEQDECEQECRNSLLHCKSIDNDPVTGHCVDRLVQQNVAERWDHRREREARRHH